MTTAAPADALDGAISTVIAPAADEVDRSGSFPRASIRALGDAGLHAVHSVADKRNAPAVSSPAQRPGDETAGGVSPCVATVS